jgi:hypothetical protein
LSVSGAPEHSEFWILKFWILVVQNSGVETREGFDSWLLNEAFDL